jgi:hypothetical protein
MTHTAVSHSARIPHQGVVYDGDNICAVFITTHVSEFKQ